MNMVLIQTQIKYQIGRNKPIGKFHVDNHTFRELKYLRTCDLIVNG